MHLTFFFLRPTEQLATKISYLQQFAIFVSNQVLLEKHISLYQVN